MALKCKARLSRLQNSGVIAKRISMRNSWAVEHYFPTKEGVSTLQPVKYFPDTRSYTRPSIDESVHGAFTSLDGGPLGSTAQ